MTQSSKEAFIKTVLSGKALTIKQYVYGILLNNQNISSHELEKLCGYKHETYSARLSDLIYDGLIEVVGTKKSANDTSLSILTAVTCLRRAHINSLYMENIKFKKYIKTLTTKFKYRIPVELLTKLKEL